MNEKEIEYDDGVENLSTVLNHISIRASEYHARFNTHVVFVSQSKFVSIFKSKVKRVQ